jgi:hypothetical protein
MKFLSIRNSLIAFVLMALALLGERAIPAWAQSWQPVYPFIGVQPQNSVDFSNPPLTFLAQGGVPGSTNSVENVPIGSVAYGSFGNATTYAAATDLYVTSIYVPADMTVTNINVLAGGTVGTNSIIGVLFNAAGTAIGNSATAGTATSGGNTFQTLALTTAKAIQGPGVYYVGIIANGTTDNVRTIAASTFIGRRAGIVTGQTFGTIANVTPPTSFTANDGPIVYLN